MGRGGAAPGKTATLARDTFKSLRTRNFRLFFVGQGISQVGNWLTLVAQSLLVLELTDSGVILGGLAAAQFGPVLLIGPWAGLVADRSDKRRLLITVQAIAMVQSFALASLAFSGDPPVLAIYAVALVGGITVAFDNPARRAFVVEMVPDKHVSNAVSLNTAVMTSSRIVGPALAGLLVTTVGYGWAFIVDGLSYVAVIAAFSMMRTTELRRAPVAARARGQVREGLRYARSIPELWVPLVMMAVVGTLSYNFQTTFPLLVTRDLGATVGTYTVLFSIVSGGALAGALVSAHRRSVGIHTVAVSSLAYGASLAVTAAVPNVGLAYVAGIGLGYASVLFLTSSTAIVQLRAAPEMRGRVLALQAMLFLGTTPIGGPIAGWVAEAIGARYAVAMSAAAAVGAGVWGLVKARSSREAEVRGADAIVAAELPDGPGGDHGAGLEHVGARRDI